VNRRGRRARRDEAGFSLVEVVVTSGLVSVLMVVFTTAILQIFQTSGRVESAAAVQSQLQLAFQRIDRELRYASWIAEPGKVGTAATAPWYVEFASSDGTECLQLRLATDLSVPKDNETDGRGVLQLIRWTPGAPTVKNRPDQTIASQLLTDGLPFDRQRAGESTTDHGDTPVPPLTPDFQRLIVRLTAKVGTSTATVDTTFTALNTSRSTPATHTCSEGRP
jgi:type II secretory pathway component PulJ